MSFTKSDLIELAYSEKRDYVYDVGESEFDSVIHFIEDGIINDLNELQKFGIAEGLSEEECQLILSESR